MFFIIPARERGWTTPGKTTEPSPALSAARRGINVKSPTSLTRFIGDLSEFHYTNSAVGAKLVDSAPFQFVEHASDDPRHLFVVDIADRTSAHGFIHKPFFGQ